MGTAYAASECPELSQDNSLNPSATCFNLILSDYKDSIDHFSEGKIYLKPEMIFAYENSLWLCNDSTSLEIPSLHCDASGYYVISEQVNQFVPWYKCTNPKCGRIWDPTTHNSTYCPVCKSPGKLQGL